MILLTLPSRDLQCLELKIRNRILHLPKKTNQKKKKPSTFSGISLPCLSLELFLRASDMALGSTVWSGNDVNFVCTVWMIAVAKGIVMQSSLTLEVYNCRYSEQS